MGDIHQASSRKRSSQCQHLRGHGLPLEQLPAEIVPCIVQRLELSDLCNLRLTSRSLNAATPTARLRAKCRSKQVDLTESALQKFVDVTKSGSSLACLVEDLNLIGLTLVQSNDQEFPRIFNQSGTEADPLARVLRNIASDGPAGKLSSVSLEVMIVEDGDTRNRVSTANSPLQVWRHVWSSAMKSFGVLFTALAASGVKIDSLNVFNTSNSRRCSLASNQLSKFDFSQLGVQQALANVYALSISLSASTELEFSIGDSHFEVSEVDADAQPLTIYVSPSRDFTGVVGLLQACGRLEDFELHFYQLRPAGRHAIDSELHNELLFQSIAGPPQLQLLKKCRLRGFICREQDLLDYIKYTSPRFLSLQCLSIVAPGSFRPIFDHITSEFSEVEDLSVEQVQEAAQILYFDCAGHVGEPHRPLSTSTGHAQSTDSIHRTKAYMGLPITYYHRPGRMSMHSSRRRRLHEYGPL